MPQILTKHRPFDFCFLDLVSRMRDIEFLDDPHQHFIDSLADHLDAIPCLPAEIAVFGFVVALFRYNYLLVRGDPELDKIQSRHPTKQPAEIKQKILKIFVEKIIDPPGDTKPVEKFVIEDSHYVYPIHPPLVFEFPCTADLPNAQQLLADQSDPVDLSGEYINPAFV